MAAGDAAAALGMPVVPATADVRQGYAEINTSRDLLAAHITQPAGAHTASQISGLTAGIVRSGPAGASTVQADLDYLSGVSSAAVAAANAANDNANHRALNWGGDANAVRYAQGPTSDAYSRTVAGAGFFQVWMDNSLQFGRNVSSIRYKDQVQAVDLDPSAVLELQPVTYHRKGATDPESREFGLIAEQVEPLVPDLVTWWGGEIDGVRYDLLSVALLAVVKDQARQLADLTARVTALEPTTKDVD